MNRFLTALFLLGAIGLSLPKAEAIAVADYSSAEQSPAAAQAPYNSFNWDFVYNYRTSSAVAVDHYWLLTAAHVADDFGIPAVFHHREGAAIEGHYRHQALVDHGPVEDRLHQFVNPAAAGQARTGR